MSKPIKGSVNFGPKPRAETRIAPKARKYLRSTMKTAAKDTLEGPVASIQKDFAKAKQSIKKGITPKGISGKAQATNSLRTKYGSR